MNVLPSLVTFVGAVICAFGALSASAYLQQWPGFKRNQAVITFVGAVFCAFGGLLAYQQQAASEQKLANLMTGGDSFCSWMVSKPDPVTNTGLGVVRHHGDHPLYDVYIRIVDLEKLAKLKGDDRSLTTNRVSDTIISFDNIRPSVVLLLEPFMLGNGDTRRFGIRVSARNGSFIQVLQFKKIDGEWVSATLVERENKVIYEEVDDKFPRTAEGNVDWSEHRVAAW